ncbi:hypothetical protein [Thiomonas sp.]
MLAKQLNPESPEFPRYQGLSMECDQLRISLSVYEYLQNRLGISRGLLQDLNKLGLVLAGGAAAALVDVAQGRPPASDPGDVDFFYKGWTLSHGEPVAGLPGLNRMGSIAQRLWYDGFEEQPETNAFAVTFRKTFVPARPPALVPRRSPSVWSFDRMPETPEEVFEKPQPVTISLQIVTVKETGMLRYGENDFQPKDAKACALNMPVFSRFDFTICRAELDGTVLQFDPDLPEDRQNKTIRLRHLARNPLAALLRINKYQKKGYTAPIYELAKVFAIYDQMPEKEKTEMRPALEKLGQADFRFEPITSDPNSPYGAMANLNVDMFTLLRANRQMETNGIFFSREIAPPIDDGSIPF